MKRPYELPFILAGILLVPVSVPCRAGLSDGPVEKAAQEDEPAFTGKEKVMAGNQDYRYTDTYFDIGLPYGLDLDTDLTAFKTNTSSWTPTVTFGIGKYWKQLSVSGTYAISGLANDLRSTAVDLMAAAHTDSEDFRTTVGGDVLVTHNISYIRLPVITKEIDIDQRTPTISLKQQIYDTRLEFSASENTYSKDIPVTAAILNRLPNRFAMRTGSFAGLIQGFPDHSEKFGIYQNILWALPFTLWATYESTHYVDTVIQFHATSDAFQYGADAELSRMFTASVQYNHLRQTGQVPTDEYGAALAVRF